MVALERLRRILERHPRQTLAWVLAGTLALGAGAPFTRWDASPELLTLEGAPELSRYREFRERFGSDEWILVGYEDPELLTRPGLRRVRELTEALWDVPGVASVVSLDTLERVEVGPFGPFLEPVIPDALDALPDPAVLRDRILELPQARDLLLDREGRTTAIGVRPRARSLDAESRAQQREVLAGVRSVLSQPAHRGIEFHLAGSPVFNEQLEQLNTRDARIFTPLTLSLLALLLVWMLRSATAVLLALACVIGTIAGVRGIMTFSGTPLSTVTSLLAPLLMVVSVSVSVHVLARTQRERQRGLDARAAISEAERRVFLPAALTAVTTAIGFGSLVSAEIPSLRSFGVFAALGVLLSFVLGAVGLPAALRLLPPPAVRQRRSRLEVLLAHSAGVASRRWALVLAGAIVLSGLTGIGASRLRVATHDGDFFPSDHPLNQAYRFIESHLSGVTPLEVVIRAREPGGLRSPRAVAQVEAMQDALEAEPATVRGVSYADWLELARRALEPGEAHPGPADAEDLERAAFVLEATSGDALQDWVQDGWSLGRISSRSVALDSRGNEQLLQRLEARARSIFGVDGSVEAQLTGLVPVFAHMEQYLLRTQIRAFGLAGIAIFTVFLLLFGSWRAATLALVPNLLPILWTLGLMGAVGVPLDVVTVMVASINLGIIVDDTIHLLVATRAGLREGLDLEQALSRALVDVGRAVVFTSLALGLGFSVLMLSEFRPTARFGGLTGLTVLLALIADLVVLPALIRAFRPLARREVPAHAKEAA